MDVSVESHRLENAHGLPIRLELRQPVDAEPGSAVIVCHGFKGFKAWGFFPYVAECLAAAGHAAITFDFSGNGIADDPAEFTRLDLFEKNTYSQEIGDLEEVIRWLRHSAPLPAPVREGAIGLVGHSRGSVPVMVVARETPSIAAVVTWNGVGRLLRYTDAQLERWRRAGRMEFTNARTGQQMAMAWGFVEDVEAHRERFDLQAAARGMEAAHLILHGSADMAVDPEEAELLRAGRETDCELVIVDGGSHTFQAVHPFGGPTPQLEEALRHTLSWFGRHLP